MIRLTLFLCLAALPLAAQTSLSLGAIAPDPSTPLEITSDRLDVDQNTGEARFSGGVTAGQGPLRLTAGEMSVRYDAASGDISRLDARGGVTFVTEEAAAEAGQARYDLTQGSLVLEGDVILTQGATALSAERMEVDLDSGRALLTGQVRTILGRE